MNIDVNTLKNSPFVPLVGGLAMGGLLAHLIRPEIRSRFGSKATDMANRLNSSDLGNTMNRHLSGLMDQANDIGVQLITVVESIGIIEDEPMDDSAGTTSDSYESGRTTKQAGSRRGSTTSDRIH